MAYTWIPFYKEFAQKLLQFRSNRTPLVNWIYDNLQGYINHLIDAPRLLVEVEKVEFHVLTDDEGNDLTFEENGNTYLVSQVWYYLGKVLMTENLAKKRE